MPHVAPAYAYNRDIEQKRKQGSRQLKYRYKYALVSICALLILRGLAFAHQEDSSGSVSGALGKVYFPISCSSTVQSKFERGLALMHNMMYAQAEKEFAAVAELDPDCAMAHWGELKRGLAAVEKAKALNAPTERERAYIASIEAFYKGWKTSDHPTRIAAWEAAQEKVHSAYPQDIDAAAFYALSHLATAPKGDKTFAHQKKAGALMEKLLAEAPEHPGLYHYTIHAYDNPALATRAVDVARGYDKLAPDVPHALHMPSHIFVRLGLWPDTIDWNMRSAAVAKGLSAGGAASLHYIHALDYLMYAYLQQGQDKMAEDVLQRINTVKKYQDSFASAYGIAAAQARYPLELRQWDDAAALEARTHGSFPWDKYPWFESITHFARGLGAARGGDIAAALKAVEKLDTFYERSVNAGQDYWAVLVDAQRKTVAAWAALAEGDKEQALKTMREAADIEDSVDKHPVTPGAVLPARELLGDMLVKLEKPAEAMEAYEANLKISPNRFNSLYGAGHAAERVGDLEKARSYYSRLIRLADKADGDRPAIKEAKQFLDKR
jgi:tetratricopeptide (TPR) repeat protein